MLSKTPPRRSIALTTIAASFGFGLVQLDVTIVNVALPTIAGEIGTSTAGLQWVVDAYALSFAALLLTGGSLGDRIGAKRVYLAGFGLFAAASIMCGLAPNSALLIAGRALQGAGAAAMLPCSLALINHATEGDRRQRAVAVGWWTAAGAVAIAAGPILGGLLLGVSGWRSIFWVSLPVCGLGAGLTRATDETPAHASSDSLDIAGQVLGVLALAATIGAAIAARPLGWASWAPLDLAAVGVAAGVGFVWREARARSPMLPLALFRSRPFTGATIYGGIVNCTYYGAVFVLSLYLQRALGYSPFAAGLAFLPLTATFFFANLVSGWWVGRAGSRAPMVVGALVDAAAFLVLAFVTADATPYWRLCIAFLLIPCGMGVGVPAMTTAVLASVGRERSGVASAVLNSARQAAGAIGVALFGALAGDNTADIVFGLRASAVLAAAILLAAAAIAAATIGQSHDQHAEGQ